MSLRSWYRRRRIRRRLQRRLRAELSQRADAGDLPAAARLAELLARHKDVDALTARADNGNAHARLWLALLLTKRGDLDRLADRGRQGDEWASTLYPFYYWHAGYRGIVEFATRAFNDRAVAAALNDIAHRHTDLRSAAFDLEFTALLRGGPPSRPEELEADLVAKADAGDGSAAGQLVRLLADRDDVAQLTARADNGDRGAAIRLAVYLAYRGRVEQLTARADQGDTAAARRLAGLLAETGAVETLKRRAQAGDRHAARELNQMDRGT